MYFGELMHPFLLGIFLGIEFLVCVYPTLVDAANSSPKWLHHGDYLKVFCEGISLIKGCILDLSFLFS